MDEQKNDARDDKEIRGSYRFEVPAEHNSDGQVQPCHARQIGVEGIAVENAAAEDDPIADVT